MHAPPQIELVPVTGILLRYAILLVMEGVTTPTGVDEIARSIRRLGVRAPDPQGKRVSDALRTEVRKGRVVRLDRDRYVAGEPLAARTRSRARSSLVEAMRRDRGDKRRW